MTYHRLVMPKHLNSANRLFGGTMMSWLDEAGAMFAMDLLGTNRLVTASISKIDFKIPAIQGDIIRFTPEVIKVGTKSLTIKLTANSRRQQDSVYYPSKYHVPITTCEMVFVTVDENGNSIAHNYVQPDYFESHACEVYKACPNCEHTMHKKPMIDGSGKSQGHYWYCDYCLVHEKAI
jgi:acyl-CoA hydrolase